MKHIDIQKLAEDLAVLETLAIKEVDQRVSILNDLQTVFQNKLKAYTKKKPHWPQRRIVLGQVEDNMGVHYAIKRTSTKTILATWIFNLQPKTRFYLLSFFTAKEALLPFFAQIPTEEEEAIINILAILLLREIYQIQSLENPLLSAIRSKIYSELIANISYLLWDNMLVMLITKKVPLIDAFLEFDKLLNSKEQLLQRKRSFTSKFMEWVNERTITELDAILPLFIHYKLIELIENFLELGYELSSTSFIARKLKLSQKTVTNRFKALNESYSTFWLTEINFEEMNLHNYFIKITLAKEKYLKPLATKLLENPYIQNIYTGSNSNNAIIYSPRFICPHIVSERLHEHLRKIAREGIVSDFSVSLIREKYRYFTLSERPITLKKIAPFEQMVKTLEPSLRKYLFSHIKRSSTIPEKDKPVNFDYNLLSFLSIIKGKYLLRARYAVWINEFKDFYLRNKISPTNVKEQINLLYYYELQAKKKKLINFSLYIRSLMKRAPNVLIIELPNSGLSNEELNAVIDKLRILSFLGQVDLYDRHLFQILGISHSHPLAKSIEQFLVDEGLSPSLYTIKLQKTKFLPFHELYDYEEQKWKIEGISF